MASVYLGRAAGPDALSRPLAVKRLHPAYARSKDFVQSLVDEAQILAQVQHPNVVQALDVVRSGDEVYVVLEYVRGDSLASLMGCSAARAPIPAPIAVAIATDMLAGLHAAHEAVGIDGSPLEVVHRDVSPQNVIIGADGHARVIDFGIAKAAHRFGLTRPGEVKGKLEYMAPEQLEGRTVDRRADVFAVGVVLWEMLTGRSLFGAETEGATMMRLLTCAVPPPSEAIGEISAALDSAVLQATRPEPESRFATAEDMLAALEETGSHAPPRVVAAWVQKTARAELAKRDQLVVALVSTGAPTTQDDSASPSAVERGASGSPTDPGLVPSVHTRRQVPNRSSGRAVALGLVIVVVVGAFIGYGRHFRGSTDAEPSGASGSSGTSALSVAPLKERPPEPAAVAPSPSTSVSPSASASTSAAASSSPSSVAPRRAGCVKQLRDGTSVVMPRCKD